MAVSTISSDFGFTTQITCILKEGNITVGRSLTAGGYLTTATPATPLDGEWVALSDDTANTFDATDGMPVVTALANNKDLLIGKVIDTPTWVTEPSASQTTWANMLTGKYYRIATVEVFPISVCEAVLVTANAAAIVPGTVGTLDVDASATAARTDGKMSVVDVADAGSNDMFSFHYAAKATGATVSLLIGRKGFGTVTT